MTVDFAAIVAKQVQDAEDRAYNAKKAASEGAPLKIASDPCEKPSCAFTEYGSLRYLAPTRHTKAACFSMFSRYPDQVEELKKRMSAKQNGALKVLDIGVAQGQEPLTHINTAFELSKGSAKTISNFLDLKTVDIQIFTPALPSEASELDPSVISHLQNIYHPRSGKSIWETPIEEAVKLFLEKGEKQDVILFNNIIQHMVPKNEETLEKTFEQLADLVTPGGIICTALEKSEFVRTKEVMRRFDLLHKILNEKGFVQIGEEIFQKGQVIL